MANKTTKICSGEYERTDGVNKVRITRVEYPGDGVYWIAAAQWDSRTSDPLYTKRDALHSADYMLNSANDPAFRI